ncbi:MAG: hypothetical protein FJX68_16215 [Alphaproteobacteria bacterium]|nr:hypothetical protein [Alphaproteobacteria bacterium]
MGQAMARLELDADGRAVELFALPTDEAFLHRLLRHLFERHWDKLTFGPMIQGAAYELRCVAPPDRISLLDGYLTVLLGVSHFHLCIGENHGRPSRPTPARLKLRRRPGRAELFRGLGRDGAPMSWGFRLFNGADEPQIALYFPNPFLGDGDEILNPPDWSRLSLWDECRARYLGLGPDASDRQGTGFQHD